MVNSIVELPLTMEEQVNIYSLETDINGFRQLKSAIEYLIQVWPGSPARPAQEQEMLWDIRDQCSRIELEHMLTLDK